jgi:outer membrane protein assembly factor BamB
MKRAIVCMLLLALLCAGVSGAWAQTVVTDCAAGFNLSTVTVAPRDQLLLSGFVRQDGESKAALYCLDADGRVTGQLLTNAQGRRVFHQTMLANDGRIWICSVKGVDAYNFGIDVVQGGKLADWYGQSMQVFSVTQGQGGILMQGKPDGFHFVFAMLNSDGNKIWQKTFDGSTRMLDVHAVDDGFLAVGRRMIPQDGNLNALPRGVVMKLSPDGEIVWRYETDDDTQFTGCTVIDNNTVVLVGTDRSAGHEDSPIDCLIAQYDAEGLSWRTDYTTDTQYGSYMPEIVSTDDGYLIATKGTMPGDGLRFVRYDLQGRQLAEWAPDLGPITNPIRFKLARLSDRIVLIADGCHETREQYMTVVHRVELR